MLEKKAWKPHSKNALCWGFFYVNDIKESCTLSFVKFYDYPINAQNLKTKSRKGITSYITK